MTYHEVCSEIVPYWELTNEDVTLLIMKCEIFSTFNNKGGIQIRGRENIWLSILNLEEQSSEF